MSPLNRGRCWTSEMARCLVFICSILACDGHTAGGGNPNPSTYSSYNNYPQQQWQQQQQQQHYPYPQNDQYQQQQQYQPQKAFDPAEPEEPKTPIQEMPPLPPGWSEHIDPSSGQPYYYNMNDGTTTWDRPPAIVNVTAVGSEDASQHQEQKLETAPTLASSQPEYPKPTEAIDSPPADDLSQTEKAPGSNFDQRYSTESMPVPESDGYNSERDGNALTAVPRDEQKIREEESWRTSQGWNSDNSRPSDRRSESPENVLPPEDRQQSQGWGLPQPQSDGWGLSKAPKTDADLVPPVDNKGAGEKSGSFRPADPKPLSQPQHFQPQHSEHRTHEQHVQPQGQKPPEVAVPGGNFNQPAAGQGPQPSSHSTFGGQNDLPFGNRGLAQGGQQHPPVQRIPPNQQNIPPYQQQQQHQQLPPPQSYSQRPLPSDTSRLPQQQGPPYYQSQPPVNPNPYGQQPQQQGGYVYGQRSPQANQYGPQYGQPQSQYPGAPAYGQQPQKQGGQPSYPSQAGQGQLVSQDQQNLVKESLGRTWQSILGLRDKTKEVVESATTTVAQSAREATQTITEKGTGWWGQAKSVLGSVFESEPTSEYSLSGIYGNSPPPSSQGQAATGYPQQPQYPSRYPPQQQYPPRGQGQPPNYPGQARYPPGYTPPQPRVDTPYPYQQQNPRQDMPPIQRQYGPGGPQTGGVPPQQQPYDPNRPPGGYYQQQVPPSDPRIPPSQQQQQQPRKPDDKTNPWSHPGLGSEY